MAASDTIIFGGRDVNGTYLSDVWILRAYNATLTKTNATWSGFQGSLQSGADANGQGVTVQYLSQCAAGLKMPHMNWHLRSAVALAWPDHCEFCQGRCLAREELAQFLMPAVPLRNHQQAVLDHMALRSA